MSQRESSADAVLRREVVAHLWNAHDWARGARWLCALIAAGGLVCAYLAATPEPAPVPRWLLVGLGLCAGAGGMLGVWQARRRPEWVAPAAFAVPSLIVAVGASAAMVDPVLQVAVVVVGLFGAYRGWCRARTQMTRAHELAAAHPDLQAARAWRGEPAVRDPYQI